MKRQFLVVHLDDLKAETELTFADRGAMYFEVATPEKRILRRLHADEVQAMRALKSSPVYNNSDSAKGKDADSTN